MLLEDIKNRILCGDCLPIMRALPDGVVDLIVTSPPYNLRNSTGNGLKAGGGKWKHPALLSGYEGSDDALPYPDYVRWQRRCLSQMMRLLSDRGVLFYNHKWRVQRGLLQDRSELVKGFPVRQILIWKRSGGMNFNPGYFLPTYEVIYVMAKPGFRLAPKANRWGDVWEIPQERNNPHPAPFPLALAERIIASTEAELIFDPFVGSGTTAVAAKKLGRSFVGIEISPTYCQQAEKRLYDLSF